MLTGIATRRSDLANRDPLPGFDPDRTTLASMETSGGANGRSQQTDEGRVMARLDMGGMELGSMAEAKPNAQSFFELGIVYSSGSEGATDLVAAHKWFNLAAVGGMSEAAEYRAEVAREMTAAAIAEAQRAAREYLQRH
jgi:hypothetical protein